MDAADHDEDLLAEVLAILDGDLEPSTSTSDLGVHDLSLMPVTQPRDPPIAALDETTAGVADPIHQRDRFVKLAPAIAPASNVALQEDGDTEHDSVVTVAKPNGKRVRKYDPNKARNNRVREIHSLRNEVSELTLQVAALQAPAGRESANSFPRITGSDDQPPATGGLRMWKEICRHQLLRRIDAERDNVRLKRAVDEQVKIAKSLQRLLEKPSALLNTDELQLPTTKRVYSLPTDSTADAVIFDKLQADVETSYHEIDDVLKMNGLSWSSEPSHGAQMRDGEHGRYIDLFFSSLFPFSLADTASVVWEFYSGSKRHRGPLYYKTTKTLETTTDTIVEKFAMELFAKNTRADFRNWEVVRRYVDEDSIKVFWSRIVEPVEFANKSFSSCAYHEKGYVVCKQAAARDSLVGSDCTQIIRVRRILPYITHSTETALSREDKREIGAMIDFVLSLENAVSHLECIEDMLMRQRLNPNKSTK